MEMSLSFRTTAANGVLLAASGLLLELSDGAVCIHNNHNDLVCLNYIINWKSTDV